MWRPIFEALELKIQSTESLNKRNLPSRTGTSSCYTVGVDMYYTRPQATLAGSRIRNWQKFECMMMLKMLERKAQDPSTTLRQCRTRFRSEVSSCSMTPQRALGWYLEVVNATSMELLAVSTSILERSPRCGALRQRTRRTGHFTCFSGPGRQVISIGGRVAVSRSAASGARRARSAAGRRR